MPASASSNILEQMIVSAAKPAELIWPKSMVILDREKRNAC